MRGLPAPRRSATPRNSRGHGETGRRKGLKIPRWQHYAGSTPAVRTNGSWGQVNMREAIAATWQLSGSCDLITRTFSTF
jgi:hypothetical protein